jgi:hypothetical protein
MLTSLFGDLGSNLTPGVQSREDTGAPGRPFAATAVHESSGSNVNDQGLIVDRNLRDLFVTGSPAQAMRDHFAESRSDNDGSRWIVMLDPSRVWAGAVVKALADAGGQPIERLHLREHGTLRTLALIERTALVRKLDESLKVFHADVRASGHENAEISLALMERAHLAAVIVGPMQPHAIDALLDMLLDAATRPSWRCPTLLFLLPPGAIWIANKVSSVDWPSRLKVELLNEPMTSASTVWNAVLGVWANVRLSLRAPVAPPVERVDGFPITLPMLDVPEEPAAPAAPVAATGTAPTAAAPSLSLDPDNVPLRASAALDIERARRVLARIAAQTDGLLACALVDSASGLVLTQERRDEASLDVDLAAAACAQALRAQRLAARSLGLIEPVDELLLSAGTRQVAVRVLARHAHLFAFALLDKHRTNLALARLRLQELEKSLTN